MIAPAARANKLGGIEEEVHRIAPINCALIIRAIFGQVIKNLFKIIMNFINPKLRASMFIAYGIGGGQKA